VKHKTWRDRDKLKDLDRIVKRNKDPMLSRLERRIMSLKKQVKVKMESF
jgi:hypothetical protein